LQSASTAVNRAVAGVGRNAAAVASASISDTSQILSALIDSRQQVLYTQAAAKMLETSNQVMETMIDVYA